MPQRIPLPREIGILALNLDGKPVEAPIWDAQGFLWLKRDGSTEEARVRGGNAGRLHDAQGVA
jgi:hypothetical protein